MHSSLVFIKCNFQLTHQKELKYCQSVVDFITFPSGYGKVTRPTSELVFRRSISYLRLFYRLIRKMPNDWDIALISSGSISVSKLTILQNFMGLSSLKVAPSKFAVIEILIYNSQLRKCMVSLTYSCLDWRGSE